MSQRVNALTFLRSTCPRCGDRLRLADGSFALAERALGSLCVWILRMSQHS